MGTYLAELGLSEAGSQWMMLEHLESNSEMPETAYADPTASS